MSKIKNSFLSIWKTFLDEFSSVRLALILFSFLVVTTLIGTILPQEPMIGFAEILKKYGKQKYEFYKAFGLTDVFHPWWYLSLMTMLGINLTVASFKRVFPKAKKAFLWPMNIETNAIKKLPFNSEIDVRSNDVLLSVEKKIRSLGYKTKIRNEMLLAVKGAWHRLGASVTHVGILTLLLGSLMSLLTGFSGTVQLSENEGFYLTDKMPSLSEQRKSIEQENWLVPVNRMPIWFGRLPSYLVMVNKTWKENYVTGEPRQWHSDLSVFDQNKNELIRKTIKVNDPLQYMGLDIYQSSWGNFIDVSFNDKLISFPVDNFNGRDFVFLPLTNDIGLRLDILEAAKEKLRIFSVSKNSEKEKLLGEIGINEYIMLGPIDLKFKGSQRLTGLQFKSDPGNILIYPGLLFIIVGVSIAFGSKKQIWAKVNSENNKILIGGNSDRSKEKFAEEFKELVLKL